MEYNFRNRHFTIKGQHAAAGAKVIVWLLVTMSVLFIVSCNNERKFDNSADMETTTPTATIVTTQFYQNIPSGSGIEKAPDGYFIVGDDSPFLYLIGKDFKIKDQYTLFDTSEFVNGRIPKAVKPDLESLATLNYKGKDYLLILGSGSSGNRNKAFLVELPIVPGKPVVKEINIKHLFDTLQQDTTIVGKELLNIEGLAVSEDKVYLLQRALKDAPNLVLSFDLQDFCSFLFNNLPFPAPELHFFELPMLQNYQAGFSGAHVLDDKLFFTASIESSPNAILDGEVLGSFVGYIPLQDIDKATTASKPTVISAAKVTDQSGKAYTGKIESLVVERDEANYRIIAVSDDDQGHSEVLEIVFVVE
ncbi:DUF6929 family protein [Pontibacter burrus]|uniref:Uncharacterized protein n=1 Tax=Pontibacter burrus TaxID=2704466 RepID=A0A6B3LJR4_9BACT|nr:hypothetical protein [Pontibacter burrus]NEM96949.1 hypothetical protein [Pontibacter burrus]